MRENVGGGRGVGEPLRLPKRWFTAIITVSLPEDAPLRQGRKAGRLLYGGWYNMGVKMV